MIKIGCEYTFTSSHQRRHRPLSFSFYFHSLTPTQHTTHPFSRAPHVPAVVCTACRTKISDTGIGACRCPPAASVVTAISTHDEKHLPPHNKTRTRPDGCERGPAAATIGQGQERGERATASDQKHPPPPSKSVTFSNTGITIAHRAPSAPATPLSQK